MSFLSDSVMTSPSVVKTLQRAPEEFRTPDYKHTKVSVTPLMKAAVLGNGNVEMGRVRKRNLDQVRGFLSPPMNGDQISYGGNPITDRVIQYRKDHPEVLAGRNVSLILYRPSESELGGYVIAATRGRMGEYPHSEMIALDKLPESVRNQRDRIRIVYTERRPCQKGCGQRNCAAKIPLAVGLNTAVLFSFENDIKAQRGINEKMTRGSSRFEEIYPKSSAQSEEEAPVERSENLSLKEVDDLEQLGGLSPNEDLPLKRTKLDFVHM